MKFFYRSLLAIVLVVMATDSCCGDDSVDDYNNLIVAGSLKQVSKGPAGVWGLSEKGALYTIFDSQNWQLVMRDTRLKEICVWDRVHLIFDSLGEIDNVFDLETDSTPFGTYVDTIYDGTWDHIACSSSSLWAINNKEEVFYKLIGVGSEKWNQVSGNLVSISVGKMGVWGIDKSGVIYYRKGTYGGVQTGGTGWIKTIGIATSITSGEKVVVILSNNGYYYVRENITANKPEGTGWRQLGKAIKKLDRYPAMDSLL